MNDFLTKYHDSYGPTKKLDFGTLSDNSCDRCSSRCPVNKMNVVTTTIAFGGTSRRRSTEVSSLFF